MISVIIPAHNEASCIEKTVQGVLASVKTPHEVIVVADHCTDRTEEIVRSMMPGHPELKVLRNDQRTGSFSNAIITGYNAAVGDAVVPVMADVCDDPTTIDRMYDALMKQNADVVCASRYMRGGRKIGGPRMQDVLSRIVAYSLKLFTWIPTWDSPNSYKMYRTACLKQLKYDIPNAGTEYSMALLFRAYFKGLKIIEVPTTWTGESIPLSQEFAILKRFSNYWFWYRRILAWAFRKKSADRDK